MTDEIKKLAPAIWAQIKTVQRILLTLHPSPDPDSVGSALALYHVLRTLGKEVTVLKGDSPLPVYLSFLPGYESIVPKNYLEINLADFDLFLIADISSPDRISSLGEIKFPPGLKTILIDHHQTAIPFCRTNLIVPEYPATAQILFELFKIWKINLTSDIASCLFLGLYADTGGFKYPRTSSETFLAASELALRAPNFSALVFQLENNNSAGQLRFQGLAFSTIEVVSGGRVALVALPFEVLEKHSLCFEDTQGTSIANHLKSVKGWEIGAELIEREIGKVTVSLRTRNAERFDLSKLALALGGGGHAAAAGATLKMPFAEAKSRFIQELDKFLSLC